MLKKMNKDVSYFTSHCILYWYYEKENQYPYHVNCYIRFVCVSGCKLERCFIVRKL